VISVCCWLQVSSVFNPGIGIAYEVIVLWPVFLEERIGCEIRCVSSSSENDSSHLGVLLVSFARTHVLGAYMLALVLVVYTSDLFTILDDLLDIRLLEDLDSIGLALCEVLKLLISTEQD
jgi:hypothetical protein